MEKRLYICLLLVCMMLLAFTGTSLAAIATPAAGSFAYDIYDLFINQILKGPIGFVAGAATVVYGGAVTAQGNYYAGIPALIGGLGLLKADTIVSSFGALI